MSFLVVEITYVIWKGQYILHKTCMRKFDRNSAK